MAEDTASTVPAPTGIKYPVLTKDGNEYSKIEDLLKDLDNEPYGYYLLGTNLCWHGGIHISNLNKAFKHHQKDRMVRCMMDGTVVAYRLNKEYPTTNWKAGDTAKEQALKYSNGFCLVKHDYVSPANKEEGANKDKTNTLTFYSLYMHLAAFSEYKQNDDSVETETGIRYILKRNRNARDANAIQTVLGLLGKNSEIEVTEQDNKNIKTEYIESLHKQYNFVKAKIISTGSGTSPSVTVGMTIYVNSGDTNLQLKNSTPVNQHKKLELPAYWQGKVTARADITNMYLYETSQDCDTHASTVFKLKKSPQQVTFDSAKQQMTSGSTKHMMAECKLPANPTFVDHQYTKSTAWMYVDQETQLTWLKITPTQFDTVVKCNIPIKAGDPIGFMGAWECPADDVASGNIESMYQMHIELFSADGEDAVKKFLNNEAGLKTGTQYLQINEGATPMTESGGRMVAMSSLSADAAGGVSVKTVVAIDGTACKEETKNKKNYYLVNTALTVGKTGTVSVHQLTNTYLDSSDSKVKKISQYDLAKLGYQIVDEPNTSTNGYVEPEQVVTGFFKTLIEEVNTKHLTELDVSEIRAAQSDPELAYQLGTIIGGHPSEWHSNTQQNIATLYDNKKAKCTDTAHKNLLDFEKSRLQACEFMSQVPLTQKVWHFHPFNICHSLSNDCCSAPITPEQLRKISNNKMSMESAKVYAPLFNKYFEKYKINTCRRKIHVLAQLCAESGNLTKTKEIIIDKNNPPKYSPYVGRGFIQLTWKDKYQKFGNAINENFLTEEGRAKLENVPYSIWCSAWFLGEANKEILTYADNDDFISVCTVVNSGFNGYAARLANLIRIEKIISPFGCSKSGKLKGTYNIEDSAAYNDERKTFGWGLWQDPNISKLPGGNQKMTDNKEQSKIGYSRFKSLADQRGFSDTQINHKTGGVENKNWYHVDCPYSYTTKQLEKLK